MDLVAYEVATSPGIDWSGKAISGEAIRAPNIWLVA